MMARQDRRCINHPERSVHAPWSKVLCHECWNQLAEKMQRLGDMLKDDRTERAGG